MASRVSPYVLIPPLVFLVLVAGFYLGLQRDNPREIPSTLIGRPAPAMTEAALAGYPGIGADGLTAGQVTLVNFWASWCPPCRAEHPTLQKLADDGIRLVGVNFNDAETPALRFLRDEGNPFTAIPFDPSGRVSFDWGVSAAPETFILAPDGTVLFRFIGPLIGSDYQQRFLPELEKALAGS